MTGDFNLTRVYRISIWRYLVAWWGLGPFILIGLGIAIFSDGDSRGAGIVIVLIIVPFLVLWHWLAGRARLEITSQGVRLHDFGGGLEAAWQDIIDMRTDGGHEGFITVRPMATKSARRIAAAAGMMQMHDERDIQLIGEQRFIPIKAFAFHLRRGDLRQVIARHAPHLRNALDGLDAPPAPRSPLSPRRRRQNWLVAVIIAASVVGSFALIAKGAHSQMWFFTVAYSVLNPLFALFSGLYAWQLLRNNNRLLGVLMLLLALVMAGWSVQNWTQLWHLLHDVPLDAARR